MEKKSNKKKSTVKKVSYYYKPSDMALEEWQVALRKQVAEKEPLEVSEMDKKKAPGIYKVVNLVSHNEYKVVYRGVKSNWNYCSCMDFWARVDDRAAAVYT